MSSLLSYKRPHGFGRVTVKKSGLKSSAGKPDALKGCAAGRGTESLTQSREVRRDTSGGHPIYLQVKAGGEKSLSEKPERPEDA